MENIPVEFLPGLWLSQPSGLEGRGSGFLLAERIRNIFCIDVDVPRSQDPERSWSILNMREDEIDRENYQAALIRIITESWLETASVIIVGRTRAVVKVCRALLVHTGGIRIDLTDQIIRSKIPWDMR